MNFHHVCSRATIPLLLPGISLISAPHPTSIALGPQTAGDIGGLHFLFRALLMGAALTYGYRAHRELLPQVTAGVLPGS